MKKLAITATALSVSAIFLAGCASEKPAEVVQPAADIQTDSPIVEEGPAEETSEEPSAPDTTPVGTTVSVGDWDITVTKVVKNADALIKKANTFNDPADGQYVLVTYTATYRGDERKSDVKSDLSWSFTGADQVSHDESYQVTPADHADKPTEARKGGTVTTDALFDVPDDEISGGLITVEGYDEEFDTVYADFTF